MRTVEWKKRNGTMACHSIYSVEEANRLEIKYLDDWREGEIGDWVKTDDGCVVEVLRCSRDPRDRKIIGTCTMTTNAWSKKCRLDTQERESRYSINGKLRNDTPKHLTANISHFVSLVVAGYTPEEAYMQAFYTKNTGKKAPNTYVRRRVKKLMESPVVKQEIQKQLGDKMDEVGLTQDWILRRYKSLIETGKNEAAIVSALNKCASMQGMEGKGDAPMQLPPIPQATLDKLAQVAGYKPTTSSEEEEPEEKIVANGPIEDAELEERKDDEAICTHVGPSGAFDPDA